MASDETTASRAARPPRNAQPRSSVALVIVHARAEPRRVGEVAFVGDETPWILGRGDARADDAHPRVRFGPHRPDVRFEGRALTGEAISRRAIRLRVVGSRVAYENVGKTPTFVDGEPSSKGELDVGQVLLLGDELGVLVTTRPRELAPVRDAADALAAPFGGPDALGWVGESPATWALRERLAFAAGSPEHVLVLGPSGSGKELVAKALHDASSRRGKPFVPRNAATLPESLADAELFGHARNFPQGGMPERIGLIGQSDGGTLFLDEIGEVPEEVQARLLRVLDRGSYHRLGESTERRADLRLVAATNREETALKHDLLARFRVRIELPGLPARREDVPLLARHLLRVAAERDPRIRARFTCDEGAPRMSGRLVSALVRHAYTHHVRELDLLLWTALAAAEGDDLDLGPEVSKRLRLGGAAPREVGGVTAERVREVLDRCDGNQEKAYRELGLSSRDALYRMLRKLGISAKSART